VELLRAYAPPRPVRLLGVRVASFEEGGPSGGEEAAAGASRVSLSCAYEDGAVAAEAEALRGGGGEVELAPGDVGAAVDDRHADGASAVRSVTMRPAGQRLVGDAQAAGGRASRRTRWLP
jgi:hypothetical protein